MNDPHWGGELKRAMNTRRMPVKVLAEAVGVSTSVVKDWRTGVVPNIPRAVLVSEALVWPALADRARDLRTRTCVCGALYVDSGVGKPRAYCTTRCYHRHYRQAKRRYHAGLAVTALEEHRRAIASFCRECEPDGVCRDAGCQLRSVSPLPIARMRVA